MTVTTRPHAPIPPDLRDAQAVADLFLGVFHRDLLTYFPHSRFEPVSGGSSKPDLKAGPRFRLVPATNAPDGRSTDAVEFFGVRYAIGPRGGGPFSLHDRRMIRAIGAVLGLRYHHLFQNDRTPRLELYRGGSED